MKDEKYILFDQYLQGDLSKEAHFDFEQQLAANPELKSEFETFKEVQMQLESKFDFAVDRETYEANLKKISSEYFDSKKPKVIKINTWVYMAAASVVLMFGLFMFNHSEPSFGEYNNYENAYLTERGEGMDLLKKAEDAFNAKNYPAALPLFETIVKDNKAVEIQYFYGITLLENNRIRQAETVFNSIRAGNSVYKNKAVFGLALAKLKQKDYKACKEILLTSPSDYEDYDTVQELMKKLD